jgi:antitoxin MazE
MQVSKWGNSLAVRIPNVVVEALKLKEGDEVEITVAGVRQLAVERDRRREKALETVRRLARPFPPGWKFDREEANEQGAIEDDRGIEDGRAGAVGRRLAGRPRTRRRAG